MDPVHEPAATPGAPEPTMSVWSRAAAVFARPAGAWSGLARRGQWWFPLLVSILVTLAGTLLIYDRAMLPTQLAEIERQVETGQIPAEALAGVQEQVASPLSRGIALVSIVVAVPLMTLVFALLPWVVAGFMLGGRLRYREAFAVTAWAGLVALPNQVLTFVLAWLNESMTGVHTGFGVLLPVADPPSKLMVGLGTFLDQGIGPLALWYVVVLALGAAALSGGSRRSVVRTMVVAWLAVLAIVSVVAAWFAPGA